jgi:hypothetical protein
MDAGIIIPLLWANFEEKTVQHLLSQLGPYHLANLRKTCKWFCQQAQTLWQQWQILPVRIYYWLTIPSFNWLYYDTTLLVYGWSPNKMELIKRYWNMDIFNDKAHNLSVIEGTLPQFYRAGLQRYETVITDDFIQTYHQCRVTRDSITVNQIRVVKMITKTEPVQIVKMYTEGDIDATIPIKTLFTGRSCNVPSFAMRVIHADLTPCVEELLQLPNFTCNDTQATPEGWTARYYLRNQLNARNELWMLLLKPIIAEILGYLSIHELARFRRLCKTCQQISQNFWNGWCQLPVRIMYDEQRLAWESNRVQLDMNIIFGWLDDQPELVIRNLSVRKAEEEAQVTYLNLPLPEKPEYHERPLYVMVGTLPQLMPPNIGGCTALSHHLRCWDNRVRVIERPSDILQVTSSWCPDPKIYRIDDGDYGTLQLLPQEENEPYLRNNPVHIYGSFLPREEPKIALPNIMLQSSELLVSGWKLEKYTYN